MLFHMFWVFASFFAIIGILECVLELLDWFSFRRVQAVERSCLRVTLKGEVANVDYLLNSLCLKAEKSDMGDVETELEIINGGLTPETAARIRAYCEKNPWVIFTEPSNNDIIYN